MKTVIWIIILVIILLAGYLVLNSGAPEDIERSTVSDVTNDDADTMENNDDEMMEGGADAMENDTDEMSGGATAELSSFTFEGYAPGKSHVGTFESYTISDVAVVDGKVTGGKITFDASTVKTDTAAVDKHLCSDDFFNCEMYPEIVFTLGDVTPIDESSSTVSGTLDFNGVKKDVSFTVNKSGDTYSADFALDTTPFAFKYIGVDKEVRIKFTGTLK